MNKQEPSEVQREKKEEKRNSGPFQTREEKEIRQRKSVGEEGKELMNAGILTLRCKQAQEVQASIP